MSMIQPPYSRKDIMLAINASAAEFEYLSRLRILRAAEGTSGNKAHRRFDAMEFLLINIIAHMWRQGVSTAQLIAIAEPFHASMDWFRGYNLVGHEEVAEILISVAHRPAGRSQVTIGDLRKFQSRSGARPLLGLLRGAGSTSSKVTYDEVVELLRNIEFDVPKHLVETCRTLSLPEWQMHLLRYCAVSDKAWSLAFVRTLYLYQDDKDIWRDDYETAPTDVEYFSTLNIVMLKNRLFGLEPPHAGAF